MADSLEAELDALRARGIGDFDPVQFRFIEAMSERASRFAGNTATKISEKARLALDSYQQARSAAAAQAPVDKAPVDKAPVDKARKQKKVDFEQLLIRAKASSEVASFENDLQAQEVDIVRSFTGEESTMEAAAGQVELKAARLFKGTLSKLGSEQLVSQAMASRPADSGPLNPQMLASESLAEMRKLSPAYLERFVSYVDTLFWLEQARSSAPGSGSSRNGSSDTGSPADPA